MILSLTYWRLNKDCTDPEIYHEMDGLTLLEANIQRILWSWSCIGSFGNRSAGLRTGDRARPRVADRGALYRGLLPNTDTLDTYLKEQSRTMFLGWSRRNNPRAKVFYYRAEGCVAPGSGVLHGVYRRDLLEYWGLTLACRVTKWPYREIRMAYVLLEEAKVLKLWSPLSSVSNSDLVCNLPDKSQAWKGLISSEKFFFQFPPKWGR